MPLTDKVIIRDASADDIADLTLLMNDLGYKTSLDEMKVRFESIAARPDYRTIVAVTDGEITGMAGLAQGPYYEKNGMYLRVLAFVVKQTARKLGIGKLLIGAAEDWAAEQGLNSVIINSGNRDDRLAAHAFYQKMGYAIKSSGFVKQL